MALFGGSEKIRKYLHLQSLSLGLWQLFVGLASNSVSLKGQCRDVRSLCRYGNIEQWQAAAEVRAKKYPRIPEYEIHG